MSKMNIHQYRNYLTAKHQARMIPRPVRFKDAETGEVIYDNTDVFSPEKFSFGPRYSGNYACPQCQCSLFFKSSKYKQTLGIICGQCKNYWTAEELQAHWKAQKS